MIDQAAGLRGPGRKAVRGLRCGLLRAALLLSAAGLPAWPPAPGMFLVAAPGMIDPNFRQSVVLLIDHGEDGSWGLVINHPTPVRLQELLPEEKSLHGREDTLFVGGPVAPSRMLLLFRGRRPPPESRPVFDDVHFSGSQTTLSLLAGRRGTAFRLYAGYAGWGPGQLPAELSRGDWLLTPAEAELVFSENLEGLWELLGGRAPLRVAGGRPAISPDQAAARIGLSRARQRR